MLGNPVTRIVHGIIDTYDDDVTGIVLPLAKFLAIVLKRVL